MVDQSMMRGNPKTQGLIRRSKYLEDAIKGLANTPQSQFSTAEGTMGNILSNAILSFAGNEAAGRAEKAVAADNDRLTAAITGTPQTEAAADLNASTPFDLTPKGYEGRTQNVEAKKIGAIGEMLGPVGLLNYQQQEAAAKKDDDRWNKTFGFQKDRALVSDDQWGKQFDFTKDRAATSDEQWRMGYDQENDQFGQSMDLNRDQFAESKRQFNETMGLNRLKMALEGAVANGAPSEDMIKLEREFSKDWKSVQGNFSDIQNQWNRMQSMASRGDAAGDLALVVSFTKMLDPGSVAREGEVALTQKAASLADQVGNLLPRLEKGDTLLPPETRKALLEAAGEMYDVYDNTFQRLAGDYKSTAEQYRMAPERVMMGYRPSPEIAENERRAQNAGAILGGTGQFNPDTFRNMRINNIPRDAVAELRADTSPEAIAEFNEAFGQGAAEAILNGNR